LNGILLVVHHFRSQPRCCTQGKNE
jgi:hypothetical protein